MADNPAQKPLVLRRTRDGAVRVVRGVGDEHTFSARHIARELGALFTVQITMHTEQGPEVFDLLGFEPIVDGDGAPAVDDKGEPKLNFTGLMCRRAAVPADVVEV